MPELLARHTTLHLGGPAGTWSEEREKSTVAPDASIVTSTAMRIGGVPGP